jgi:hypothetical protein
VFYSFRYKLCSHGDSPGRPKIWTPYYVRKAVQFLDGFPPSECKLSKNWTASRRAKASFPKIGRLPAERKQAFQKLDGFPPDESKLSNF